jgi:CheY-like chemotaxis protein
MFPVTTQKTATVLIVEDDGEMRSLLCDEFLSAGYRLREAKDGDEALKAVLQSEPDLILTDLRMRNTSDACTRWLRTVRSS